MDGSPPKKKRRGWRAEVSDDTRQTYMFAMVRAIYAASRPNARITSAPDEARRIEWEIFNSATSPHEYETRIGYFLRSLPAVTQAPGESSTPQIRDLEPQHVASSSSNAGPVWCSFYPSMMAGNPSDEVRPDWRAAVSEDARSSYRFDMVSAIYKNSDTKMMAATEAVIQVEEELFNAATSVLDYQTRVGNFLRSRPAVTQATVGSSTPQIRYLGPQHVAESSSGADRAMGDLEHINALRNAFERYDAATTALEEDFVPFDLIQQSAFEKSKRDTDVMLTAVDELRKAIVAGAKKAKHLSSFLRTRMRESGVIEENTVGEAIWQQMKAMKKNENIVLALEAQPRKDNVASSLDGSSSSRQDTSAAGSGAADGAQDSGAADVRAMPPPKMMPDYETRVGNFLRSLPAVTQAPSESSTPQIRDLEPQHVASSSSNAGPAGPVDSNNQAGQRNPEQQPDGVRLNVDLSSAPVDTTLQSGPSEQQNPSGRQSNADCNIVPVDTTLRMGPSEQQNLSGRQSDSDCNPARVDMTLRLGYDSSAGILFLKSHLSGRQCDSDRNNVPSSMPISPQPASRSQPTMPVPPQQVPPQPQLFNFMPIPRQPAPPPPRFSIPSGQQVPRQPRLFNFMPIPEQQDPPQPPISISDPRPQVPQQQAQLPRSVNLSPPPSQWQISNLAFVGQWRWPAVRLGQLVHVRSPLLPESPRQRLEWWAMVLPRMELPPEWLERLSQDMLPVGYVWGIHFPTDTWWFAQGLLPDQLWPQLLSILPSDPQSLRSNVIIHFPPSELQLDMPPPPPQQPPQQQPGRSGDQAGTSSGKQKAPEGK